MKNLNVSPLTMIRFVARMIASVIGVLVINVGGLMAASNDFNGDETSAQLQLQLIPSVYSNGYNISCFGYKDGSINLVVSGGTAPYQYKWSTGDVTEDISNLPTGYYKVVVVDAHGKTETAEITLKGPEQLKRPEITSVISLYPNGYNVSCYNCFNGSIDLTITGGSGAFRYKWEGGVTTQDRSMLGEGAYKVVIKDTGACGNREEYFRSFDLRGPRMDTWTMSGNTNSNPPSQYIGTSDNKDLVFKTNSTERLRISSDGNIGINKADPAEKFDIGGNLNIDGKLIVNQITSPDSLIRLGDSTLIIHKGQQCIYPSGTGLFKGMSLGYGSNSLGSNTITIGYFARSFASTSKSVIIGSSTGTGCFASDISNSLIVGFNSNYNSKPTFLVGPAGGTNNLATGNIGISTANPTDKLQIGDGNESITFGSTAGGECGNFQGYMGFNAKRIRNDASMSTWVFSNSFGGAVIGVNSYGTIQIIPVSHGNASLSDAELYNRRVVTINPGTLDGSHLNGAQIEVNGNIKCKEVKVTLNGWPDYVFKTSYDLLSIKELEEYIHKNNHLPGVPTESDVEKDGVDVGEMNSILLKKIEELTLYVIELKKEIDQLKKN